MLDQEFMRNALLAGTFVALACGVSGWFAVLRGQMFAGDALGHVAFPGALAAAAGRSNFSRVDLTRPCQRCSRKAAYSACVSTPQMSDPSADRASRRSPRPQP